MLLALILFANMFPAAPAMPLVAGRHAFVPQAASPPQDSSSGQSQPSSAEKPVPSPKPAVPATAQTPAAPTKPLVKHPRRRRVVKSNCASPPAAASGAGESAPADPAGGGTAPTANPATAETNCPPPKKIVRQGGTSDPNIQLAGGTGGQQATQQRTTANQMLDATEENIKKISGRQLSAGQRDVLAQIHQFVDQSKAASASGDLERARTLAWKAQTLSEELAKPAQ